MAKPTDLTTEATAGYSAPDGARNPYYVSSAAGMAWTVGAYLRRTGRSSPRGVRMGRGYQVHANDMLLAIDGNNAVSRVS